MNFRFSPARIDSHPHRELSHWRVDIFYKNRPRSNGDQTEMKLKKFETAILLGCRRRQPDAIATDPRIFDALGYGKSGIARARRKEAAAGLIQLDLQTWLGRPPTSSDAIQASNVYRSLETRGLVERSNRWGGTRTTDLTIVELGASVADEILKTEKTTNGN